MLVRKSISLKNLMRLSGHHVVWLLVMMASFAVLYYFNILTFKIPWLAVSVIGTAVAFYAGFKNNQAYDRMWEARKIWGGIVNDSRSWGMMVDGFITNLFTKEEIAKEEIQEIKKEMIYRHIAWLYAHRSQLLIPTEWEHINQGGHLERYAKRVREQFGVGLIDDDVTRRELGQFLPKDEHDRLVGHVNTATQIINEQSRNLTKLR